jgi:hypothetical protein
MSERLPGTALEADRVVPGMPLTEASTGEARSLWSLRQRFAAIVLFLHADCQRCAVFEQELRGLGTDVERADGRIVVTHDTPARFLGDGQPPVAVVLDRYGAAFRSYPAPGHAFPPASEVVETLWHLATMCPECGVSTW